jgi:hypothetical protein
VIQSYLEHGFSLIPVEPRGKMPVGKWAHAQSERASRADVELWLHEGHNLGLVTGELSGVVVVDCDSEQGVLEANKLGLPVTPTATTGNGKHYFLRHPGQPVKNAVRLAPDLDVRGDGGFVVVPPSVHPSGAEYRWVDGLSLEDLPPAECPAWLLEASQAPQNGRPTGAWVDAFSSVVGKGERNQRCAELAGHLLRKSVDPAIAFELLLGWNERRVRPPMSDGEVRQVVRSINEREQRRRSSL